MKVKSRTITLTNIVLVFDDLRKAQISRDQLRCSIPEAQPEYLEVPDLIAINYPELKAAILILLDQGRLGAKINLPETTAWKLLPKMASHASQSIQRSILQAYEFNFFSDLELDEGHYVCTFDCYLWLTRISARIVEGIAAREFVLRQFQTSLEPLTHQISGELTSISPQLNYVKGGVTHQLNILPELEGGDRLSISPNVHFDSHDFPDEITLSKQFSESRQTFEETIEGLFGG